MFLNCVYLRTDLNLVKLFNVFFKSFEVYEQWFVIILLFDSHNTCWNLYAKLYIFLTCHRFCLSYLLRLRRFVSFTRYFYICLLEYQCKCFIPFSFLETQQRARGGRDKHVVWSGKLFSIDATIRFHPVCAHTDQSPHFMIFSGWRFSESSQNRGTRLSKCI